MHHQLCAYIVVRNAFLLKMHFTNRILQQLFTRSTFNLINITIYLSFKQSIFTYELPDQKEMNRKKFTI